VLVVDDERTMQLLYRRSLTSAGFEVVIAKDGPDGLQKLREDPEIRVVLLDLNMPVMDGVATLKALRQQSDQVAIVMLTSLASLEVVEECLDLGADYHLRKDLPVSELKQEILDAWRTHVEDLQQGTDPA
jgi:CheY-like chemotaxis protein